MHCVIALALFLPAISAYLGMGQGGELPRRGGLGQPGGQGAVANQLGLNAGYRGPNGGYGQQRYGQGGYPQPCQPYGQYQYGTRGFGGHIGPQLDHTLAADAAASPAPAAGEANVV